MEKNSEIIIYNTDDGKANVSLMAKDGNILINTFKTLGYEL